MSALNVDAGIAAPTTSEPRDDQERSALSKGELEEYLARIEYHGPLHRSVAVLNALMLAHVCAIPFENLDVLANREVRLASDAVLEKLVRQGRGGYCFEHNGLFARVLVTLGFPVRPLAARARVGRERQVTTPRTHLCLEVVAESRRWLVDVGIGGLSMTAAIPFEPDVVHPTPHEPRRLRWEAGRWWHQAWLGDRWADVCELTGESMPPVDQEVANWYTSTHPDSPFRHEAMFARAHPDGSRLTLRGDSLTVRRGDAVERRVVHPMETLLALVERRSRATAGLGSGRR